jgi:hypothetical protein
LWAFAALVVGCLVIAEAVYIGSVLIGRPGWWRFGQDFGFYRDVGARWLADGSYYLPRQLGGPYVAVLMADVLYPPSALLLFVPFAVLPAVLWWAVPIGLTLYVLRWLRPASWALCVMLALLLWPRAIGAYLFGNTDIWAVAAICAGLRWGWPAVLLTIKPTFAPLALLGVRRRSWWIVAGLLGVASLLMLPLWLDYLRVMANVSIGWTYSLGSIPLVSVPIVAWMGSSNRTS